MNPKSRNVKGGIVVYRIGMFSKINRVTVKTLRYYDKAGLLKPAYIDRENDYRYYTSEQLPELHKIISLRQSGFSINEISALLNGRNIVEVFENRKHELEETIKKNEQQLSRIKHYLELIKEDFNMNYEVALKELPEVIVYSRKMNIPDYNYYFEIIPKTGEELIKSNPGIKCVTPAYCFIIYLDGEYKEKNFNVEFCEAVTAFGKDTDIIKFKKVKKVPVAACVYHKGPYSTIKNAYMYIFKWIDDNGYIPGDNPRESYIDGIWNKKDEKDWLTELQVPIKNK